MMDLPDYIPLKNFKHMRISLLVCLFSISVVVWSCKSKDSEREAVDDSGKTPAEIMDEKIMDIHDEVMPKMGELYRQKKRLTQKLDSATTEQKQKIELAIQELDSAMTGMNVWMRQYEPDSADVEKAEEYFDGEMKKVSKVKDDILKSLDDASKF
jgi:hypothetical protein